MYRDIDGDLCHQSLLKNLKGKLSFDENNDFSDWKKAVYDKLYELLKLDAISQNSCPINVVVEEEIDMGTYTQIRFTYDSEKDCTVPCYLLIPNTNKKSYPLVICLQGHTNGMHISINKMIFENDSPKNESKFATQAVAHGYAALCIEQRGMGERRSIRSFPNKMPIPRGHQCAMNSLTALQLGRNTIGERVWDVQKGIDAMSYFPKIDTDKIMILGTSGGGTASFYSACIDSRIKYCAPSCSFCSYKTSIMNIEHCVCNFVPDICLWFEMEDLSCLIAPRPISVLTGLLDEIFPIDGVRNSYKTLEKIYEKAGASDKCKLIEMPKAHWFCADIAWEEIERQIKTLGWK